MAKAIKASDSSIALSLSGELVLSECDGGYSASDISIQQESLDALIMEALDLNFHKTSFYAVGYCELELKVWPKPAKS